MSSRLFQTVREERGLAYAIHSFDWTYEDTGLFGFYAATAAANIAELMPVGARLPRRSDRDADARPKSQRAKAQLKVSLLMALESSSARAEQIARQHMAFGRVHPARGDHRAGSTRSRVADARRAGAAMLAHARRPVARRRPRIGKVPTPDQVARAVRRAARGA